jgi:hypothetical protein
MGLIRHDDDLFEQNYRNIFIVKVYKYSHITYRYMNCKERSWSKIENTPYAEQE